MANEAISQRPEAAILKDDDLIPISQKQSDGSYLTCRVTAKKLKGKDGINGINGAKGANGTDGVDGDSAYDSWFNANSDIEAFLKATRAVDVLDDAQITELLQQTGLSLQFDDYLSAKLLIEFYEDLQQNNPALTLSLFLEKAALKPAIYAYLANYLATTGYASVYRMVSNSVNDSDIRNYLLGQGTESLATQTLETIYQTVVSNFDSALTREDFANQRIPDIALAHQKESSGSVAAYLASATLVDVLISRIFNDDVFANAVRVNAVDRYVNSRKSTSAVIAGLLSYNVNTMISDWITEHTPDWFKQLPLLTIARKWTRI